LKAAVRRRAARATVACAALLAAAGHAATVTFNGTMGDKALLVIDGQPRMLARGASVQGIKLLSMDADDATVEVDGRRIPLRLGAPARVGSAGPETGNREIVLSAGPGGHFYTQGSINGKVVQFLVDTGATAVALGQGEADRIGLDYRRGQRLAMNTANGVVPAYVVNLTSVRVGEVEVYNVQAVVLPAAMDHVLLGNTFLTRFQMKRENDVMRLEKR
jgi:aspartyl protease family protein